MGSADRHEQAADDDVNRWTAASFTGLRHQRSKAGNEMRSASFLIPPGRRRGIHGLMEVRQSGRHQRAARSAKREMWEGIAASSGIPVAQDSPIPWDLSATSVGDDDDVIIEVPPALHCLRRAPESHRDKARSRPGGR